jgi:hypothetical protein
MSYSGYLNARQGWFQQDCKTLSSSRIYVAHPTLSLVGNALKVTTARHGALIFNPLLILNIETKINYPCIYKNLKCNGEITLLRVHRKVSKHSAWGSYTLALIAEHENRWRC